MTTEKKRHDLVENYVLLLDGHADDWNLVGRLLVTNTHTHTCTYTHTHTHTHIHTHTHTHTHAHTHTHTHTRTVNHRKIDISLMNLTLSCIWWDGRVWAHWNLPLSIRGQYLVSHLESPQVGPSVGVEEGWLQWLMTLWPQHPLFADMAGGILYLWWHEFAISFFTIYLYWHELE